MLPKFTKEDLIDFGKRGYKVLVVKDEKEANEMKDLLRLSKRCARVGVYHKGTNAIPFVLTKEREKK